MIHPYPNLYMPLRNVNSLKIDKILHSEKFMVLNITIYSNTAEIPSFAFPNHNSNLSENFLRFMHITTQ